MAGSRDQGAVSHSFTASGSSGHTSDSLQPTDPIDITLSTPTVSAAFHNLTPGREYVFGEGPGGLTVAVSRHASAGTTPPTLSSISNQPPEPNLPAFVTIDRTVRFADTMNDSDSDDSAPASRETLVPVSAALPPHSGGNYHTVDATIIPVRATVTTDEEIDLEGGEGLALIPRQARQGWCAWIGTGVYNYTVKPVVNTALYAWHHPFIAGAAAVTAATPALTALANPAGITPDKLGADWWNNMNTLKRLHSLTNCGSSFTINAIMNAAFLTSFWDELVKSIGKTFDSTGDFLDNGLSIVFAAGGAIAQAAIAYNAFLWLPAGVATASVPALISFSITLASRYLGVKGIFRQLHHMFNEDAKTQAEFADALDHIDESYLEQLHHEFNNLVASLPERRDTRRTEIQAELLKSSDQLPDKKRKELEKELNAIADGAPVTKDEFEYIEKEIARSMTNLIQDHPDLIKDKTCLEYLGKYSFTFFKLSFAFFLIGAPYFLTFMQKGFDGVNTLSKFAGNDLVTMNAWVRRLIGFIPGLASGMMAFNQATQVWDTLVLFLKHLYAKPGDIPFAIPVTAAIGFAASSPQNVALGVLKNPDNITGFHNGNTAGTTYEVLNALAGGGVVNGNISIKRAFLSEKPTPGTLQQPGGTVQYEDMLNHVRNVDGNLVHHSTAHRFRLFLKNVPGSQVSEAEKADMQRNKSFVV